MRFALPVPWPISGFAGCRRHAPRLNPARGLSVCRLVRDAEPLYQATLSSDRLPIGGSLALTASIDSVERAKGILR